MRPRYGPTVKWCGIDVTRIWRCGCRGSGASVLIEKPARGDFLPILHGGFSLQYSPLMEYREGQGMVNLIFDTTPGRTYQVQYKDNLSDKDWLALNPRVVADNATLSSFDSLNSGSQRFYRIVQFD